MTPVGARLRAPTRRRYFQVGRGLSPPAAGSIFTFSKDKVQLFLERIQIPRGPGAALALPASSMSQTSLGSLSRPCAGREWVRGRRSWIRRGLLQSSATSDSCVNVKARGRMPPAARAEPLETRWGKTMTPVGARLRAPAGVVFSRSGSGG